MDQPQGQTNPPIGPSPLADFEDWYITGDQNWLENEF